MVGLPNTTAFMAITPSNRLQVVQTPIVGYVQELIETNPGTISLGQGVSHYGPPKSVVQAAAGAVRDGMHDRYGFVIGTEQLRSAVEQKLTEENRIDPGSAVVVTAGSNMAFFETVLAITDPGDEVILLRPYYFNHLMAAQMANCVPVVVATDDDFQPDIEAIEQAITPRTRAIVTISPNNPTGVVYSKEKLVKINTLCGERGIYHISDEAYEYFTYGGAQHYSPGSISGASGHTVSIYSFSKAFGMAGWRIGYAAMPPSLVPAVRKIQDTNLICAPLPIQVAATAALEVGAGYCRGFVGPMGTVRRLVLDSLQGLGSRVQMSSADGAFYVFAKLNTDLADTAILQRLIEDHGVAVIPGSTFGQSEGTYLRIAYGALLQETVEVAMDRLCTGLRSILE